MKDPRIIPIAITLLEKNIIARLFQEINAPSPFRRLDDLGIDIQNPLALPFIILEAKGFAADPWTNAFGCLNHTHLVFALEAESDVFIDITMYTELEVSMLNKDTGLLSGTLHNWKDAIFSGCAPIRDREFRKVFNQFYNYFKAIKLRQLFADNSVKELPDGTFILK